MPFILLLLLFAGGAAGAAPRRLVLIKADGLPAEVVERWVRTSDPKTGRSALPWIEHVFLQRGAWMRNFYTRGISLSAPSWAMLDSGEHMAIRGNAEYDRFTLRVYDYLNFFPFYLGYARARRVDMPAVEVMDQAGWPLLIDRYPALQRLQSPQLFQRGVRWRTLQHSLRRFISSRSPRQLFDEWQVGFDFTSSVTDEVERELIAHLADPRVNYLDYFFGDYDHVAHLASGDDSILDVLKKLDALVGRIWTAIEASPRAADTVFVLVSDHGMNTQAGVYSQGYNLLGLLGSVKGGGHHVVTNRHPLTEYKIKGLDPFVSEVTTPATESYYLRGEAAQYPTAALDLDGNERAAVYLRNSDFNRIQILLQRLSASSEAEERAAIAAELMRIIDRRRSAWSRTVVELEEELAALSRAIARQRVVVARQPRRFSKAQVAAEIDDQSHRERVALESWLQDESGYGEYLAALRRLLALNEKELQAGTPRIDQLVPRRSLGDRNTVHDLQNYIAGPGRGIDYFALFAGIRVRNNVQAEVGSRPVDLVAARIDAGRVFVYADAEHQAILSSKEEGGRLFIRYEPVAALRQEDDGSLTFTRCAWGPGFPLHLFEDGNLETEGDRAAWLSAWHSDAEWLAAAHRTVYSNGLVGLVEYFAPVQLGPVSRLWKDAAGDTALLRRFEARKRSLVEADMLVIAANHWNFNVRGFNPGGNHGSFFRASTHAVWMLQGAGVPQGLTIERPYDSLSFLPSMLKLGGLAAASELVSFPGPIVEDLNREP